MNKNFFLSPFVCLFILSSCQFPWSKKAEIVPLAPPISAFDESLKLDMEINNFRLDGFTDTGKETKYLVEKQKLIDSYKTGNRSLNVIRTYIYLSGLEGDFATKNTLEKELCQLYPDTCAASVVQASISGAVRTSLGKPIADATVEVLGTSHTTTTDAQGKYSFNFETQSPTVLRLRASTDETMIDIKKIQIDDSIRKSFSKQEFEKNFTLITPFATHEIDTVAKTITGANAEVNNSAFVITTPYTKYSIPFGTVMNGEKPYQ